MSVRTIHFATESFDINAAAAQEPIGYLLVDSIDESHREKSRRRTQERNTARRNNRTRNRWESQYSEGGGF